MNEHNEQNWTHDRNGVAAELAAELGELPKLRTQVDALQRQCEELSQFVAGLVMSGDGVIKAAVWDVVTAQPGYWSRNYGLDDDGNLRVKVRQSQPEATAAYFRGCVAAANAVRQEHPHAV